MKAKLIKQIQKKLIKMGICGTSIQTIMDSVKQLPANDHLKGALNFLTEVTAKKSQRESYYKHSKYLAEYFCTLSNLGMFAVGYYYKDYTTLAAATFSALSHAIPAQRLHDLDMLGVFMIFAKALNHYKLIMEKPQLLAWGFGALSINIMDTIITRSYLDQIGPSIHVVWHLTAAFVLYKFNQAEAEFKESEIKTITEAISLKKIPSFLKSSYDKISESMDEFSHQNKCVIS